MALEGWETWNRRNCLAAQQPQATASVLRHSVGGAAAAIQQRGSSGPPNSRALSSSMSRCSREPTTRRLHDHGVSIVPHYKIRQENRTGRPATQRHRPSRRQRDRRSNRMFICPVSDRFSPSGNSEGPQPRTSTNSTYRPSWRSPNDSCRARQTYECRRRSTTSSGSSSSGSSFREGLRSTEIDSIEPPQRHHLSNYLAPARAC